MRQVYQYSDSYLEDQDNVVAVQHLHREVCCSLAEPKEACLQDFILNKLDSFGTGRCFTETGQLFYHSLDDLPKDKTITTSKVPL